MLDVIGDFLVTLIYLSVIAVQVLPSPQAVAGAGAIS
jgi:hypothetical protein